MKRQILRILGVAALATGGLLAAGGIAHADPGSTNGNRFTYIYQRTTVVCGNAIGFQAVAHNYCGAYGTDHLADLDSVDGIFDLDLDYSGDTVDDDAGRWFHADSRTWS